MSSWGGTKETGAFGSELVLQLLWYLRSYWKLRTNWVNHTEDSGTTAVGSLVPYIIASGSEESGATAVRAPIPSRIPSRSEGNEHQLPPRICNRNLSGSKPRTLASKPYPAPGPRTYLSGVFTEQYRCRLGSSRIGMSASLVLAVRSSAGAVNWAAGA